MSKISIWVDGGCRNNQSDNNIGAWAYMTVQDVEIKEDYRVELNTTNNAQELKACIEALKSIKDSNSSIEVMCDSAYVVNGMNNWTHSWKTNDWTRGKKKETIMNLELWKELDELRYKFDSVVFLKVKGHSDNEGNNRVDELVNKAMDNYNA